MPDVLDRRRSTRSPRAATCAPERGRRGAGRDHGRQRLRGRRSPAFLIALRTKGETGRRARRPGRARCARWPRRSHVDARRPVDTAGTGGGRPTFNVSTTAALIAAGAGCARGQARQPLGHRPVAARPTCSRRSASASTSRPTRVGALHRRGRLRLHVRARPPPGDALRRPGAQGARGAHDLQLPRPAHQPGRRHAASSSASPTPRFLDAHRRRARAPGGRPGAGSVQRGRARRDEHVGHRPRSSRSTASEVAALRASRPRTSGLSRGAARRRRAAARPSDNAAITRARSSPASTGPARDLAVLNAGAAIYAAGRADALAGAACALAERGARLGRGGATRSTRCVAQLTRGELAAS